MFGSKILLFYKITTKKIKKLFFLIFSLLIQKQCISLRINKLKFETMIEIQIGSKTVSFRIEKNGNYWLLMNDDAELVMVGYEEDGEVCLQDSHLEVFFFKDELFEMVKEEFNK